MKGDEEFSNLELETLRTVLFATSSAILAGLNASDTGLIEDRPQLALEQAKHLYRLCKDYQP